MSDSDGDMDMYPNNDIEFAGENLVSKLSPTRSTTKVSTPLDDRKSESEASKAFSEDEDEEEEESVVEDDSIFVSKLKPGYSTSAMVVVPTVVENSPVVVSVGDNKKLAVWDMRTGQRIFVSKSEHSKDVTSIAYYQTTQKSESILVTGSDDSTAIVWDMTVSAINGAGEGDAQVSVTIDKKFSLADDATGDLSSVAVGEFQGAPYVVLGGEHGIAVIYNLQTGAKMFMFKGHEDSINSIAALGKYVVTGSDDCTARVWDVLTGEELFVLKEHDGEVLSVAAYQPIDVDQVPIVVTGGSDHRAIVWELTTGRQVHQLEGVHEDWVRAVAVCGSADGHFGPLIVTGSDDGIIGLWNLTSGESVRVIENTHSDYINCLASFVSLDKAIPPVILSGSDDGTICLWKLSRADNAPSKKVFQIAAKGLITKLPHDESVSAVDIYVPADGLSPPLVVTACNNGKVTVWDLSSAKIVFELYDEDHEDWILALGVFTPIEGSTLPPMVIAGCYDGASLVYNLTNGKKLGELDDEHNDYIAAIAVFSPRKGDHCVPFVVTGSADRTAIVWSLKTLEKLYHLKDEHDDTICSIAIYVPPKGSGQDPQILTGSEDESVVVWDFKNEKPISTIRDEMKDSGSMNAIAVYAAPDESAGPIVITGNEGGHVYIWDLATGALLRSMKEQHQDGIFSVVVYAPTDEHSSPFFVTGSADGTAVVWDLYSGAVLRVLRGVHDQAINAVALYAPPKDNGLPYIVTGGDDDCAVLWNLNAEQMQSSIEGGHAGAVTCVAAYLSPNPNSQPCMLSGSEDGALIVWELKSGKKVRVLDVGQGEAVTCLAVFCAEDGSSPLAMVGVEDSDSITVWDLLLFKKLRTLNGHANPVTSLAVHAPGALLLSGGQDSTAIVWNIRSGKKLREWKEHTDRINAVAVHVPAKKDAQPWALTASTDNTVVICLLNSGKRVGALLNGHQDGINALAVMPVERDEASTLILTGCCSEMTIVIWSAASFMSLRKIVTDCEIHALAVHIPQDNLNDAVVIACALSGTLSVWNVNTGAAVRTFDTESCHTDQVRSICIYAPASGSALVVSGSEDKSVIVWNYRTGERHLAVDGGHAETITSLAVVGSLDDSVPALLVTASLDRLCIVWDINTNKKIRTLENAANDIHCVVVYSPDGAADEPVQASLVIAGTASGVIDLWDLHSGAGAGAIQTGEESPVKALALFVDTRSGKPVPMLVSGAGTGSTRVFTLHDQKQSKHFSDGHTAAITSIVAKVRETFVWIVTGSEDATIVVRDFDSGTILRKLSGVHSESVTSLALFIPTDKANAAPILLSGSEDCTAVAWDLRTGEVRKEFKGQHTASITSVSIQDQGGAPLAVTGGSDGSVVVWNLYTGHKVRKLEGNGAVSALAVCHSTQSSTSSVLFVANGERVDVWADCLLGDDYMPFPRTIQQLLEHDLIQTSAQGHRNWSRIQQAAAHYGDAFWLENYHLFTQMFARVPAIRDAFFKMFKDKLHLVIHLLPGTVHKGKLKSLLEICIDDNLPMRRIFLEAWVAALNYPCEDYLNQAFHPSTFFDQEVLYKLADRFPTEFIEFICRLQLVKSSALVNKSCASYNLHRGIVIEGMPAKLSVDMWTTIAGYYCSKNAPTIGPQANQPVTPMMVPLIGAADMKMLNAYVNTSNAVGSLDIFESEVGVTAFKYAWFSFGLKIHVMTTLRYLLFIVVFTTSVFTFDRLQRSSHLSISFWAWFQQALVLAGVLYYIVDESRQFWSENKDRVKEIKQRLLDSKEREKEKRRLKTAEDERESKYAAGQHRKLFLTAKSIKTAPVTRATLRQYAGAMYCFHSCRLTLLELLPNPRKVANLVGTLVDTVVQWWTDSIMNLIVLHFAGFWNMIDLSVLGLVSAGTIVRIISNEETDSSRCILSVACVMVWFKVLNFMRPFKHSGPLIAMILRIMQDIQFFVFILAIVLTGFSMAFWLISYPDTSLSFGTIEMSFYNTYLYMLGQNIEADFAADTASPRLGIVLLVAFMFFMMILMLNLLIALMGNSYSKVQEKGLAEWRLGQASMILEQSYLMNDRTKRAHEKYNSIHVLKYSTLLPQEDGEGMSVDKRLHALESTLVSLEKKLDDTLQKEK